MKTTLENWKIIDNRVYGNIMNDVRFKQGEFVRTSEIIRQLDNIIETQNTLYLLGTPLKEDTLDT